MANYKTLCTLQYTLTKTDVYYTDTHTHARACTHPQAAMKGTTQCFIVKIHKIIIIHIR